MNGKSSQKATLTTVTLNEYEKAVKSLAQPWKLRF